MNLQSFDNWQYHQENKYHSNLLSTTPTFVQSNTNSYTNLNLTNPTTTIQLKQRPNMNLYYPKTNQNMANYDNKYRVDNYSQHLTQSAHLPIPMVNYGPHNQNNKKYQSQIQKLTKICEQFFHQNQRLKQRISNQNHRLEQIWGKKVAQLQNQLYKHRQIIQQRNKAIIELVNNNKRSSGIFGINSTINPPSNSASNISYIQNYHNLNNQHNYNNQHTAHRIITKTPNDSISYHTNSNTNINNGGRIDTLMQQLKNKQKQLSKYMQKQQKYIEVYVQKQQLQKQIRNLQWTIQSQNKQITQYRKSLDKLDRRNINLHNPNTNVNNDKQTVLSARERAKTYTEDTSASFINMNRNNQNITNSNTNLDYNDRSKQKSNMNMNMHIIVQDNISKKQYQQLQRTVEKLTEYNNKLLEMLKMSSAQIERLNNILKNKLQQIQTYKNIIQNNKAVIENNKIVIQNNNILIQKKQQQIQRLKQLQIQHERIKVIALQFKGELNGEPLKNSINNVNTNNYTPNESVNNSHSVKINSSQDKMIQCEYQQKQEEQNTNNKQITVYQNIGQQMKCERCWNLEQKCENIKKKLQQAFQITETKANRVIKLQREMQQLKQQNRNLQSRLKEQVSISWELKQMMIKMDQLNANGKNQMNINKQIPEVENQSQSSRQDGIDKNHEFLKQQSNMQPQPTYQSENYQNNNINENGNNVDNKMEQKTQEIPKQLQSKLQQLQQQMKSVKQENKQLTNFVMKQNSQVLSLKDKIRCLQDEKKQLQKTVDKLSEIKNNLKLKESTQNMQVLIQRVQHTQQKLEQITKHYEKLLCDAQSSISQTQSVHKKIQKILENKNQFIFTPQDFQLQPKNRPRKIYSQNSFQYFNAGDMPKMKKQQKFNIEHGQGNRNLNMDKSANSHKQYYSSQNISNSTSLLQKQPNFSKNSYQNK